MEDVNKQRRNFISLSELGYGPLKFSFRKVGPCGFRPFDFYSKLKIENQKFTIEISICLIPQELKITNLQS